MATFEIYRDGLGDYRWRLRNEGGVIAVGGKPFASRAGAERMVEAVVTQAPSARVVDLTGE